MVLVDLQASHKKNSQIEKPQRIFAMSEISKNYPKYFRILYNSRYFFFLRFANIVDLFAKLCVSHQLCSNKKLFILWTVIMVLSEKVDV